MKAVLNNCERWLSSRSELMATRPAIDSTAMNSKGCCSMTAHISTIVKWVMKAVRESINTRMKIGTMAYGSI